MSYHESLRAGLAAEMQSVISNLEDREWIQGDEVYGEAVCAHGAVMTCKALRPGDEPIIRAVMRTRGVTEKWNDEDGRTKSQVLARMRLIKVSDADLADTFGPNWPLVITVIRKAAILTFSEVQRLAAAWTAVRVAALAAARDAAHIASRDCAGDAAREAAWSAAWDATWDAKLNGYPWVASRDSAVDAPRDSARDAAMAAVVADLVGRHGLTQDHLDTLVGPWVGALGDGWAEGMLP